MGKENRKPKRNLVIPALALTALLLSACGSTDGGTASAGSVTRMANEVDAGNYVDAAEIYANSIYGNTDREYQARQELEARLDQAVSDFNTGAKTYNEASNVITTVDRVNVLSLERVDRAQDGLDALQKSKAAFESAEALFASGLYTDALENYLAVVEDDTNYTTAQQKAAEAREYFLDDLDDELNGYLDANEYTAALDRLDEARLMLPDEVSLSARETEIEAKFLNYTLEQAEEVFSAGKDYESAIRVITTAQNTLGENDRLAAALENYQSYIPVYLNELEYFDSSNGSGYYWFLDNVTDNYGNNYKYALKIKSYTNANDIRYYLGGEYSAFSGTIAMPEEKRNSSASGYIEIYGDDVLLYASPTIEGDTLPQDFSIDVSSVTFLRILGCGYSAANGCPPMLCDAILQK